MKKITLFLVPVLCLLMTQFSFANAPILSGSSSIAYTEGNSGTVVNASIVVTDTDSATLASATIAVSVFVVGDDRLLFTNNPATMGNIAGSFNGSTGIMTLTSSGNTATLAQWQEALRAVKYTNLSQAPAPSPRTIAFTVNDGEFNSNTVNSTVSIIQVNDRPQLSSGNTTINYTENNTAAVLYSSITVFDFDSPLLAGATISITNFVAGEDVLSYLSLPGGISGNYNAATGVMSLTGAASQSSYQTALRAIRYSNTSDNPSTTARNVTFTITDETSLTSFAPTSTVTIILANDACTLSGSSSIAYTEGNSGTIVNASIVITDIDTPPLTALASATIAVSVFMVGDDRLLFTNNPATMGNIAGSFNGSTGIMTLTSSGNTATLAQWQEALRAVKYTNLSQAPAPSPRTIAFTVNDGEFNSNTVNSTVSIIQVNDRPQLSSGNTTINYTENNTAAVLYSSITVFDFDSPLLAGATISITNFVAGEDVLSYLSLPGGISGNYNAATGVMSLTGAASQSSYQTALREIRYSNTSDNPSTTARNVTFIITDETSLTSFAPISTVTIIPTNDSPVLSGNSTTTYTENSPATAISPSIVVTDADSATLATATVALLNYVIGQDMLDFTNIPATMGNISGSYNTFTGTMTLDSPGGTATLVQWQAALRAVSYFNTSDNPSITLRPVSYTVNDGVSDSNTLNSFINVAAVNNAPIIGGTSAITYVENDAPIIINPNISPSDPDSFFLYSASVLIVNFVVGQDVLSFSSLPSGITGNYDSGTGLMTLSGLARIASYQTALRSIAYSNTSDNPSIGSRNISFSVSDGPLNSGITTSTIAVFPFNDPPELSGSNEVTYTENSAATAINPTIIVSDVDSATLRAASITITNYVSGEDVLSFTNNPATMGNITGSFNATVGLLVLNSPSNTATVAQWQTALRAVRYLNTSNNPSTADRLIGFTISDSLQSSNTLFSTIAINAVSDAPVLSGSSMTSYVENSALTAINSTISINDIDSATLSYAIVSMINYIQGEDFLNFTNVPATMGNIAGSISFGTVTLISEGNTATLAEWQAALRSVTYGNTSDNPTSGIRGVGFYVNDGVAYSNLLSSNVTVIPVNDMPILSSGGGTIYIENSPATAISPSITVFDVDNVTLPSATITIVNYVVGQDELSFTNDSATMGNITGNISFGTIILTSAGNSATVAQWQAALRAVYYSNTSESPSTTNRFVSYIISDGMFTSSSVLAGINIIPVEDAPVLSGGNTLSYIENNAPLTINSSITISDVDNGSLFNATVAITNFVSGQDVLDFSALPTGISGNYNSGNGVLIFSGSATVADYQSALRSVTYSNTSDNPLSVLRTVSFTVNDGSTTSNTINSIINITAVSDVPAISGGYCPGATTVSGTSPDGDGTVIDVYKAGAVLIGSTTVSGGLWTVSVAALSANDMITARATVSGGTQSAASSEVTVNANPNTPTISAGGSTTFCIGNSVTLTAAMPLVTDLSFTAFSTGTHGTDQWQSFVPTISGATTAISFFKNGNAAHTGTFSIYNGLGTAGAVVYSQPYSVTNTGVFTINLPNLTLIAGDTYTFRFLGTDVGLIANNGSYGTYFSSNYGTNPGWRLYFVTKVIPIPDTLQWYNNGNILNGATGATYVASASGVYTCMNANGGCSSNASNGISVTTIALPAAPTITAQGPTTFCLGGSVVLTASSGSTYLWSNGAATQSITVSTAGDYSVQVTNSFGCLSPASLSVTITTTPQPLWYLDADGDHYYTGAAIPSCTSPGTGYIISGLLGGGDCNDASDTVYPNAPEICYNNILENCSGTMSQGCIPVVVNMTPSYHNTILASLSTSVPAVSYTYPGTANLKYRYSITNLTTGITAPDIIQASRYVTIPASIHLYGAGYTIRASAVINEEIVAYAGNTITVFGPTVQLVALNTATCGATLTALTSTITANPGLNATGYTFRIRLNDANPTPTYAYSPSATRFVSANSFTGFPLQYASSYKVAVQYTYNDPITNQPVQSGYGAECTVNTPTIPVTGLAAPVCGSQVTAMNANISAAFASYATGYQFRIRLFTDNGPTPTYYYSVPNASRFSSLTAFQGIALAYNTAYSISVQYSIVNGGTVWSDYGLECKVTTPFFPTTSLVPSQCGLLTATELTQQLNITPYPGFPHYKVKLEEVNGENVIVSQEREIAYSYFKLGDFPIAQLGKNYNVSVAIKLNGIFGDYSTACDLFTPGSGNGTDWLKAVVPFKATAYPNPFANNFMLDVKTTSQSPVSLKVYDMLGRMIEQRDMKLSDMETATIGSQYPCGVYNLILSQGETVETIRVIKR
jgi:hypothetical protein